MAGITFEQFFSAIVEQESGGNYKALGSWVAGDRAYGKYQVMGANVGNWTAKYYGRRLTPTQFLNNPSAQDAVARGVLKSYFNAYGPRGAAAAWYAGPGNHNLDQSIRAQPGGPSIKGYVDSVMAHAVKYPAGGGEKVSTGSTSTTAAEEKTYTGGGTKPMNKKERAAYYGYSEAFFSMNKELRDLLNDAQKGDWSSSRFSAELMDTKWYRSLSGDERKFIAMKKADPKSASAKLDQAYVHVRQLANQMGLRETPGNKKKLDSWAYNMAAKGWNDEQLRNEIGKYVYFNDDTWQGEGGETQEKLRAYAYSMGVEMSSQWYADKSRNVIRGIVTEQDYEDEMRKKAKSLYSNWADQIDAGKTVAELASSYLDSMSKILELPSGSVNLFDPTVKKALQYKDPQTGKSTTMPLWQFENQLRSDSRWKSTQNAQNSLMQVGHQILSDFGFAY